MRFKKNALHTLDSLDNKEIYILMCLRMDGIIIKEVTFF